MKITSKHCLERGIYAFLLLFIISCATEEKVRYTGQNSTGEGAGTGSVDVGIGGFRSMPWEVWTPGRDLNGQAIVTFGILTGDERAKKGERLNALEEYLRVDKTTVPANEREALALRVASMQLSLGQTKQALDTISSFFTSRSLGPDAVSPEFGLVLAFAYGQSNNMAQSFAWFSRVHSVSPPNGTYAQAAASGVRSFLRTVPTAEFETLAQTWAADNFVNTLVGQERHNRATLGLQVGGTGVGEVDISGQGSFVGTGAPITIGMLLPLSGKFGMLGKNTANGIELAFSNAAVELGGSTINFAARDTIGDSFVATSHARELFTSIRPTITFGPLLSDPATAVAEIARDSGNPLISFSKKSIFPAGNGVFRLGATPETQVDSLLAVCKSTLGINRFALVYANDANGLEFAAAFRLKVAEMGGEILYEKMYNKDDYTQLVLIAQEVERYKVQAIFFPDSLVAVSRFATSLSASFRTRARLLGTASWDDPIQLARFQIALDNSVFVSPFFVKSERPVIKQFVESYKSRYNQEPDFLAAQGFDAATLVIAALKRTLQLGTPVSQALLETGQYEGLTGRIFATTRGELQRSFALAEFKGGLITEIVPGGSASPIVYRGDERIETAGAVAGAAAPVGDQARFLAH